MSVLSMLVLLFTHPLEFRTLLQYNLWHNHDRDLTAPSEYENTGWDRQTMRRCWYFLDMTSRSFSGVIKELDGDLARLVCLFYLVLRGLDTMEDDMTLPDEIKQPLLRKFHELTVQPGWTFTESGPNEKDRQLLVEYDNVITEVNLLDGRYREIIIDICQKMEGGMADYAHKAATTGSIYLEKIEDYDLYCHYVAGLVGEGLTRIWSASGREAVWLGEQLELSNAMGTMLQKTNIIRDFREDVDEKRFFWPRQIWGRELYGKVCGKPAFKEMTDMYAAGNEKQALWALSGMVVNDLGNAIDSLDYLRLLQNQKVFNFCAIPQTMAMATLALCFMNYDMFHKHIKIRKAEAASLIMRSTNPRDVAYMFRDYARVIHGKASTEDPNFIPLSVACGKIETWCEHYYPSYVSMTRSASGTATQSYNPSDVRTKVALMVDEKDRLLKAQRRAAELKKLGEDAVRKAAAPPDGPVWEFFFYVGIAVSLVFGITGGGIWFMIKYF